MDRLLQTLVFLLIVVGIGNAFVTWDADRHARDAAEQAHADSEREECLQRVEATAVTVLLTPENRIDEKGRIESVKSLGATIDAC